MDILLVTGEGNTGKSGVLHDLTGWLLESPQGYTVNRTFHNHPFTSPKPEKDYDVEVLLSGKKRILVHSGTDDDECIKPLCENLDTLANEGNLPDILITTCRRPDDDTRKYLCSRMGWTPATPTDYDVLNDLDGHPILEIPLIRIKYDAFEPVNSWYKEHINRVVRHILLHAPYDI